MKTYPLYRDDGTLRGFEVRSSWVLFRPLFKVLKSIDGVSEIKRQWFKDDRISFKYLDHKAVVNEPWGDNSRYWIGLESDIPNIDISPIHAAFKQYNGSTII